MTWNINANPIYNVVSDENIEIKPPDKRAVRSDSSGIWNYVKAWYIFLVHMAACCLFSFIMLQYINDHNFQTGSPPSLFDIKSGLYQTQVTGLISVALVIIRLLTGAGVALLVWRTIFILLEKRGITLKELTRLSNHRIPIFPQIESKTQMLWSLWAMIVAILLWPPLFVAPVANSSVAWNPSTKLGDMITTVSMADVGRDSNWASLLYPDMLANTVITGVTMAGRDPAYAFNSNALPTRRYFSLEPSLPGNSIINVTVPYFDVSLRWIDAATDNRSQYVASPAYSDLSNQAFQIRNTGTVAVVRNDTWNAENATPKQAEPFIGTRLISIKVNTMDESTLLPNGTHVTENTPCPTTSEVFGELPDVGQKAIGYFWSGDNGAWAANDCYLVGEATITAGRYQGTNCLVSDANFFDQAITCTVQPEPGAVEDDWLASLSVDFMSEVMKNMVMLSLTGDWMNNNLDNYTTGMLRLGYHAAWSALMHRLDNLTEPATTRTPVPVVRANIDSSKVYIWLGMNITLTISALLVLVAQGLSTTKTIRDTTLAALTLDLTEVTHNGRCSSGLCSAVTLQKKDSGLPRLVWMDIDRKTGEKDLDLYQEHSCRQKVVFASG